ENRGVAARTRQANGGTAPSRSRLRQTVAAERPWRLAYRWPDPEREQSAIALPLLTLPRKAGLPPRTHHVWGICRGKERRFLVPQQLRCDAAGETIVFMVLVHRDITQFGRIGGELKLAALRNIASTLFVSCFDSPDAGDLSATRRDSEL